MLQTKLEDLVFVVGGSTSVIENFVSSSPVGDERLLGCLNL